MLPADCRVDVHPALRSSLHLASQRDVLAADAFWAVYELHWDTAIVILGGEIDFGAASHVEEVTKEATTQPGVHHLLYDLSDVTFMDSSCPRLLAAHNGADLIGPLRPQVGRLRAITGLLTFFYVYPTRDAALCAVAKRWRLQTDT